MDPLTQPGGMNVTAGNGGISEVDVRELLAICPRLYEAVGWHAGKQPDWATFRSCFHPDAILAPMSGGAATVIEVETFIQGMHAQLAAGELKTFSERELANHVEAFANIASVRSTFVASMNGVERQGVTFAQMVRHSGRWVILSVVWDNESPGTPVPANLL